MRIPRRLIGGLLAHEGLIGRPPRRAPRAPPGGEPPLPPFLGPPGPQDTPGSPQGVLRDHTDPYGSIRIHKNPYGPLPDQFSTNILICYDKFWRFFGKVWQKNVNGQSRHLASKQPSGAFGTCRARKVSMDEPGFSPNGMRNCLIINRKV